MKINIWEGEDGDGEGDNHGDDDDDDRSGEDVEVGDEKSERIEEYNALNILMKFVKIK